MVRKNPLPPGRYWIFVQQPSSEIFDLWLKQHSGEVQVEKREDSGGVWPFISPLESFVIFRVDAATVWPRGVGFPNAADPATTKAADVVTRPPPPTVKDVVKDIEETAAEAASAAMTGTVVIAAIVLWVMSRNR